jgi:membrane protein YqaA with SNARE-associated domain
MAGIVNWIQTFALSIGAPGLFLVAFLDSSFLSLPQINDLLLIVMIVQQKPLMPVYAASATLGSIVGCMVPYYLGRKGGEALVHKRFGASRANRAIALLQRHGVLAVLLPALLPPPAPFKLFVILAGVARIPVHKFIAAIAIGRGIRYFGEGFLAVRYGDGAMLLMEENGRVVALLLVGLLVAGAALYFLIDRRRRQTPG